MKKIIAIFTVFIMISATMISCKKDEKTTINFLNWGENIAEGLIDEFEEKYNIKVNLTTNGTLFPNIAEQLGKLSALHKINFSLHSENNLEN